MTTITVWPTTVSATVGCVDVKRASSPHWTTQTVEVRPYTQSIYTNKKYYSQRQDFQGDIKFNAYICHYIILYKPTKDKKMFFFECVNLFIVNRLRDHICDIAMFIT